jgi:hypothetical protein
MGLNKSYFRIPIAVQQIYWNLKRGIRIHKKGIKKQGPFYRNPARWD